MKDKEKLHNVLENHLAASTGKIIYYHAFPGSENYSLMKSSVEAEIKTDLITALKICALIFSRKDINRTLELIDSSQKNRLLNAMEMLDLVLPKKITKEINYLFDFVLEPDHSKKTVHPQDVSLLVKQIVYKKELLFQPWSKAVCMYSSWKNNLSEVLVYIKEQPDGDKNTLMQETKDYILNEIN